jgi:hypothetical protein
MVAGCRLPVAGCRLPRARGRVAAGEAIDGYREVERRFGAGCDLDASESDEAVRRVAVGELGVDLDDSAPSRGPRLRTTPRMSMASPSVETPTWSSSKVV